MSSKALRSLPSGERSVVNLSGIRPIEFNVLVRQKEVEEKTKGGIIRPDVNRQMEQAAAIEGVVVAVSPLAFTYEKWPDGMEMPKPGDKVFFAKFAGMKVRGNDDVEYIIVKDKDLAAVIV
jgi:co-chaperonin GroES (HSP10)